MQPTKHVWTTNTTAASSVDGVLLHFGFTRTRLLAIRVWTGDDGQPALPMRFVIRLNRAVALAANAVELPPDASVHIEATYFGERPDLIDVVWFSDDDRAKALLRRRFRPGWIDGLDKQSADRIDRFVSVVGRVESTNERVDPVGRGDTETAESLLEELEVLPGDLAAPPDGECCPDPVAGAPLEGSASVEEQRLALALFEQRRAAIALRTRVDCFLLTFDRLTYEGLTAGSSVANLSKVLAGFQATRWRMAKVGQRKTFTSVAGQEAACKVVMGWFEDAMNASGLAESEVGFAFEMFVSGRASVVHPDPTRRAELSSHGATNSKLYFLFPELAIAAARLPASPDHTEADRVRWADRAGVLVRAAHALATYRWTDLEATTASSVAPITPYAYFDGYSMSFRRIEAHRSAYEAARSGWGLVATSTADERTAVWEDLYGRVLLQVKSLGIEDMPVPYSGDPLVHDVPAVPSTPEVILWSDDGDIEIV